VTQIYIGIEINYLDRNIALKLIKEAKEVAAMIASLIKIRKGYVKEPTKKYNIDEPRT